MNKLQKIINEIARLIKGNERDLEHYQIVQQIYDFLNERYEYCWIAYDMTDENGDTYIVFSSEAKLYRVYYSYNGSEISIQEPTEVEISFYNAPSGSEDDEMERSLFNVYRDTSNKLKFVGIAASSVLNRVNEIDSKDLFDDFEKEFQKRETVKMSFYHAADIDGLNWGTVDGIARYGNLLLFWGTVNEQSLIGRDIESIYKNLDIGFSIGYMPTEEPEIQRIGDFPIKVYRRGYLREISLILEAHAANYFTQLMDMERGYQMARTKDELKKSLVEFLGNKAEKEIDDVLEEVEGRNRTIKEAGMITREETQTVVEQEEPEVEPEKDETIIVDEAISNIVEDIVEIKSGEAFAELTSELRELRENFNRLGAIVNEFLEASKSAEENLQERLANLEKDDDTKIGERILDLPTSKTTTRILYRPSQKEEKGGEPGKVSLRNIAKTNLNGENNVRK